MEKIIMTRKEFLENIKNNENNENNINEGFFSAILNFFKKLFDLFNDKKVKKSSEEISKYYEDIIFNKKIKNLKDIIEELDIKKIRKVTYEISRAVNERINVDIEQTEKSKLTFKDIQKLYSSWLAMLIAQQESCKLPIIERMIKNNNLSKRFSWVPKKFRKNPKEFYKEKESELNKNVAAGLLKVSNSPKKDLKNNINNFSIAYLQQISKQNNKSEQLKNNDNEWLHDLLQGLSVSMTQTINSVSLLLKNTPDDKLKKVISEEIMKEKKKQKDDKKEKLDDKKDDKKKEKLDDKKDDISRSERKKKNKKN